EMRIFVLALLLLFAGISFAQTPAPAATPSPAPAPPIANTDPLAGVSPWVTLAAGLVSILAAAVAHGRGNNIPILSTILNALGDHQASPAPPASTAVVTEMPYKDTRNADGTITLHKA